MDGNRHLTIVTNSPEETERAGRIIGSCARAGLYVGLRGCLGAGKTVLVRGIARGLDIDDYIVSPTFQLMREYSGREKLFHLDFYRLGTAGDAVDLDIAGCLSEGIVAVEWSDLFEEIGGDDHLVISLEWTGESGRRISFERATGIGLDIVKSLESEYSSR